MNMAFFFSFYQTHTRQFKVTDLCTQ
jgi:hypothetical protein